MQERLFSKPYPSPSGSLDAELQTGKPAAPLFDTLPVLFDAGAELTTQDWLFSQPKPSPSESDDGEEHTGSWANADPECREINKALAEIIEEAVSLRTCCVNIYILVSVTTCVR